MTQTLTPAQREELKALLLQRRAGLQQEMQQNRENLSPPTADEVDQALTDIDAADLTRIDRALKAMADGSYGQCGECGCGIPFERLQIEPQTEHCVACKERWEKASGQV
jgi:DnaK suppressor protein